MKSACAVSVPASSPPWKLSVGLACMPCSYSNSGAAGAAAYEPLAVEPLAAVVWDSLPLGTRLLNNTKTLV